jgi:hypothetical protein
MICLGSVRGYDCIHPENVKKVQNDDEQEQAARRVKEQTNHVRGLLGPHAQRPWWTWALPLVMGKLV